MATDPLTVVVDLDSDALWELQGHDRGGIVRCQALDDAMLVAYFFAAHGHPCELVVRDAHQRVVKRKLVGPERNSADAPQRIKTS